MDELRLFALWLCSQKRGPQRSVDMVVSAAFIITLLLLSFLSVELLKVSWGSDAPPPPSSASPVSSQGNLGGVRTHASVSTSAPRASSGRHGGGNTLLAGLPPQHANNVNNGS